MVPKVPILPNWTSNRWGGLWSQVFPLHPSGATFYINSQRVYSHQPPAFIHESFKTKPLEMYVRNSFALVFHPDTNKLTHVFSWTQRYQLQSVCVSQPQVKTNKNNNTMQGPLKSHGSPKYQNGRWGWWKFFVSHISRLVFWFWSKGYICLFA